MNAAQEVKVTRCKNWPNNLGFDCTVNGTRFMVTSDRELGRLVIIRENSDQEITHSLRVFDGRGSTWATDHREVAKLAYRLWRDQRSAWTFHE